MNQKEKEEEALLISDLSARLQYGVKCKIGTHILNLEGIRPTKLFCFEFNVSSAEPDVYSAGEIKPYLRPMSSMTEEEEVEYDATFDTIYINGHYDSCMSYKSFDFLNKKMFDYRGLIPNGLALEAPNNMYK